ncbi:acyl-Coenzyme A oxidase [Homalodisca vitripennis]|nr:acyl-Coenzyme A oxidase [Homalodisca vitripennis]
MHGIVPILRQRSKSSGLVDNVIAESRRPFSWCVALLYFRAFTLYSRVTLFQTPLFRTPLFRSPIFQNPIFRARYSKPRYSEPRAALGTLIGGRIGVCNLAVAYLTNAISIAVRYSAARRQFGPGEGPELSIIEYQLQQWRLFPHLAALFAFKAFTRAVNTRQFHISQALEDPAEMLSKADELLEMHAVTSAAKAVCSWTAAQAIQECREACGGHGYLKCETALNPQFIFVVV